MRAFSPSPFRLPPIGPMLLAGLLAVSAALAGEEPRPYREGRFEKAELRYIDGLPVLVVQGTPAEMGRQKAALTGDVARKLADYPRKLIEQSGRQAQLPKVVELGNKLLPQFPAHHRDELRAFADKTGLERERGILANTLIDTYREAFACSSLLVSAERSATGGPLFGRNLDFYSLGILDRYSLVTVHRPQGKRAFATIGYPGLFGCISGMNDAGLAVAVHEVFLSRDHAPMFNPKGIPYALLFRRILEECATVQEAEKLLRSSERTTKLNLAVCDREDAGVLEMTPKTVAFRRGEDGVCACTNHFRTQELALLPVCRRYNKLVEARGLETIGIADVAKKLHEVHQGKLTVQTMIFEPRRWCCTWPSARRPPGAALAEGGSRAAARRQTAAIAALARRVRETHRPRPIPVRFTHPTRTPRPSRGA